MAYTIMYNQGNYVRKAEKPGKLWLAGLAVLLALAMLWIFWPQGMDRLRRCFLPWQEKDVSAFSDMVEAVQAGETVAQAVSRFCRQVIFGGQGG